MPIILDEKPSSTNLLAVHEDEWIALGCKPQIHDSRDRWISLFGSTMDPTLARHALAFVSRNADGGNALGNGV
jgi:hypothetical protein